MGRHRRQSDRAGRAHSARPGSGRRPGGHVRQWGAAKPDPAFFAHVIEVSPGEPHEIVYVGDHPRQQPEPAKAAELRTAFIRRGPSGYLWAEDPKVRKLADWRIDSLASCRA